MSECASPGDFDEGGAIPCLQLCLKQIREHESCMLKDTKRDLKRHFTISAVLLAMLATFVVRSYDELLQTEGGNSISIVACNALWFASLGCGFISLLFSSLAIQFILVRMSKLEELAKASERETTTIQNFRDLRTPRNSFLSGISSLVSGLGHLAVFLFFWGFVPLLLTAKSRALVILMSVFGVVLVLGYLVASILAVLQLTASNPTLRTPLSELFGFMLRLRRGRDSSVASRRNGLLESDASDVNDILVWTWHHIEDKLLFLDTLPEIPLTAKIIPVLHELEYLVMPLYEERDFLSCLQRLLKRSSPFLPLSQENIDVQRRIGLKVAISLAVMYIRRGKAVPLDRSVVESLCSLRDTAGLQAETKDACKLLIELISMSGLQTCLKHVSTLLVPNLFPPRNWAQPMVSGLPLDTFRDRGAEDLDSADELLRWLSALGIRGCPALKYLHGVHLELRNARLKLLGPESLTRIRGYLTGGLLTLVTNPHIQLEHKLIIYTSASHAVRSIKPDWGDIPWALQSRIVDMLHRATIPSEYDPPDVIREWDALVAVFRPLCLLVVEEDLITRGLNRLQYCVNPAGLELQAILSSKLAS